MASLLHGKYPSRFISFVQFSYHDAQARLIFFFILACHLLLARCMTKQFFSPRAKMNICESFCHTNFFGFIIAFSKKRTHKNMVAIEQKSCHANFRRNFNRHHFCMVKNHAKNKSFSPRTKMRFSAGF